MTATLKKRRNFLRHAAAGMAATTCTPFRFLAHAQDVYPSKPVRLVVPSPAGQGSDVGARALARRLGDMTGQAFVVDNQPGGNQAIGARAVIRSRPDGYSLFLGTQSAMATNAVFLQDVGFDAMADFSPVCLLMKSSWVVSVSGKSAFRSFADVIAAAKAQPSLLTVGTGGSSYQLGAYLLAKAAGIELTVVPYKGAPQVLQDLAGEQIALAITETSSAVSMAKAGLLRPLLVMSDARSAQLPAVPTIREAKLDMPGFFAWAGLFAPASTPRAVRERIGGLAKVAMQSEEFSRFLVGVGFESAFLGPDELAVFQAEEIAKYRRAMAVGKIAPQ